MSQRDTAAALVAEQGQTFAEEAGFDVAKGTPAPLFGLLVLSLLLSSRIQARLAVQAAVELRKARLTSAKALAEADAHDVWAALDRGDYLRKERTTSMLQDAARHGVERWGGDLRKLRAEAGGSAERAAELLEEFKGIGDVGAEVFLREVQVAWEELQPFVGSRAVAAAKDEGLPADAAKLARLVEPEDVARLSAALVRSGLTRRLGRAALARVDRRHRAHAGLRVRAADLAREAEPREAGDLELPETARRVVGRQVLDEPGDPVAQLEREVRGRGAHELAHVVDRHPVAGVAAGGELGFAHGVFSVVSGMISSSVSSRAWSLGDMARASPTSQPWL